MPTQTAARFIMPLPPPSMMPQPPVMMMTDPMMAMPQPPLMSKLFPYFPFMILDGKSSNPFQFIFFCS